MFKSKATTKLFTLSMAAGFAGFGATAHAEGGDWGPGSGGDMCEDKIQIIRDDIRSWIGRGGSANLDLPEGVSVEEYNQKMLLSFQRTTIACDNKELFLNEDSEHPIPKMCINETNLETGESRITCEISPFLELEVEDQYRFIHHEFAGVAGLERNELDADGYVVEESSYALSRQLGAFLEEVTVKRLAIAKNTRKAQWLEVAGCSAEDYSHFGSNVMLEGFKRQYILDGCKSQRQVDLKKDGSYEVVRERFSLLFTAIYSSDPDFVDEGCLVTIDSGVSQKGSADKPFLKYDCGERGTESNPALSFFVNVDSIEKDLEGEWAKYNKKYYPRRAIESFNIGNNLGAALKAGFKVDH